MASYLKSMIIVGVAALAGVFYLSVEAEATPFTCDSGTLDTTCVVSTAKTGMEGQTLSGAGRRRSSTPSWPGAELSYDTHNDVTRP